MPKPHRRHQSPSIGLVPADCQESSTNTDHPRPWGWKVGAYFLTKGISAGIAIAAAIALAAGVGTDSVWMRWLAPPYRRALPADDRRSSRLGPEETG